MIITDYVKEMNAHIYLMWFLGLLVAPFAWVLEVASEIWNAGQLQPAVTAPTYVMRTQLEPGWALREYRLRREEMNGTATEA